MLCAVELREVDGETLCAEPERGAVCEAVVVLDTDNGARALPLDGAEDASQKGIPITTGMAAGEVAQPSRLGDTVR